MAAWWDTGGSWSTDFILEILENGSIDCPGIWVGWDGGYGSTGMESFSKLRFAEADFGDIGPGYSVWLTWCWQLSLCLRLVSVRGSSRWYSAPGGVPQQGWCSVWVCVCVLTDLWHSKRGTSFRYLANPQTSTVEDQRRQTRIVPAGIWNVEM
jgi:hypothetical protein